MGLVLDDVEPTSAFESAKSTSQTAEFPSHSARFPREMSDRGIFDKSPNLSKC